MRVPVLALVVLVSMTVAPYADDARVAGAFGNTISVTNATGEETLVWMSSDQSYQSQLPNGDRRTGTWSIQEDRVCFQVVEPAADADNAPTCGGLVMERKPGDSWTSTAADGSVVAVEIISGVSGQ
jgi:hypothetical protein